MRLPFTPLYSNYGYFVVCDMWLFHWCEMASNFFNFHYQDKIWRILYHTSLVICMSTLSIILYIFPHLNDAGVFCLLFFLSLFFCGVLLVLYFNTLWVGKYIVQVCGSICSCNIFYFSSIILSSYFCFNFLVLEFNVFSFILNILYLIMPLS